MRRLFALVAAVVLVDTMFYASIAPLLPNYAEDLDLSKPAAGVLSASYAAGTLVASIPAGFFAARAGVRPAVLTGLLLLSASSVAFAFAEDVVLLDLARFTQGAGGAAAWTGGLAWILAAAPRARRGEMVGSVLAVAITGIMLGPVVGGIATAAGPEPVFTAVAMVALALVAWAARTPGAEPEPALPPHAVARATLSAPVLAAFWLVALPAMLSGLFNVLVPLRLDDLGASGIAIGAVFLVAAAIEAAVSPAIGSLSDRRGRIGLIRAGLLAAGVLAIVLPLPRSVLLLAAATVAVVLAMSLLWTPAMALLNDRAESAGLDLAFGAALINISWAGGQVVGGSAGPGLADATSDAVAYGVVAVLFALTFGYVTMRRRASAAVTTLVLLAAAPVALAENPTPPGPEFDGEPAEYASAFAAKEICSRVFIARGDPAPIINDMRAASALAPGFAIDLADIRIDRRRRMVTVDHPGQPARSAVRARDNGCVILPAYSGRLHFRPRRIPWRGPSARRAWPAGEVVRQGRSNIDRLMLDAALAGYIRKPGTRAVVVVHRGELVGEAYAPGFGPFTQQRSWSTAKSITATLAGLLFDRGRLRLDGRPPLLSEWDRDARREITVRHLLNMSSGLRQNQFEGTERSLETFTPESEHAFIYFDGFDTYADALEAPLEVPPGTRWQYRNANVLSLAASMRRVLARRGRDFSTWAHRNLLEPLGMRTTTLETDQYGQFIASGTAFTTARDLARLGLVHLQGGRYRGRRFLSREWVRFVTAPSPAAPHYGGFWWLNHERSRFPSVPEDAYFASGAFGQYALVVPSHDLVIARMGLNLPDDDDAGLNLFAGLVISAIERGELRRRPSPSPAS